MTWLSVGFAKAAAKATRGVAIVAESAGQRNHVLGTY
jgi:hypothetical protein